MRLGERGDPDHDILERRAVGARRATIPRQEGRAAQRAHHPRCAFAGHWRQADLDVALQLGRDPARAARDHGAELRVGGDADKHLDAARRELLDQEGDGRVSGRRGAKACAARAG